MKWGKHNFSPNWICVRATTRFECMSKMCTKQLLKLIRVIMNSWSCHLAWPMLHRASSLWWIRYFGPVWESFSCFLWWHTRLFTKVEYLGHVISQGVVSMDRTKVDGVLDWSPLTSVNELRGFLGLSGYYKRFLRGYGLLVKPLTVLLKNDVPWQ